MFHTTTKRARHRVTSAIALAAGLIGALIIMATSPVFSAEMDRDTKFKTVVGAMIFIKRAARDPDSVVWDYAGANKPGTAFCIEYRARNGFGGFNREHAVFTNAGISQSAKSWNRNCANKELEDFTFAKHAVP